VRLLGALLHRMHLFLDLVTFPHTVFALPFAFMGAILAARGLPSWSTLFWILAAMVGARSGAMAVNRLADHRLDALNPRTRERVLPKGLLSRREVMLFTAGSFALFIGAAARLNALCLRLAPFAIAVLVLYPFTKRFTALSHLILGLALGMAPLGGWIAVTGSVGLVPVVLGMAVLLWVAGFDILYALADIEFDRSIGLHSIPARLGPGGGMAVARVCHAATVVLLVLLLPMSDLGGFYLGGVAAAAALLLYEHLLLLRHGLGRLDTAFFTANGLLSIALFGLTLLDVLL